jgi:hypothetical protein
LLDITKYGATTNNGTVTGSIVAGTNRLTVLSVGDFAVGHGIWVSNVCFSTITNIVGNNFMLKDMAWGTASGTVVKHDNAPVINNVIQSAQSNDVVYVPAGAFVIRMSVYFQNKSYVTLRGAPGSQIVCLGGSLIIGPTALSVGQGKTFAVMNLVLKGSNQILVATSDYAPWGEVDRPGCLTLRTSMVGREIRASRGLFEWFLSHRGETVPGFTRARFSGLTTPELSRVIADIIHRQPDLRLVWGREPRIEIDHCRGRRRRGRTR